ncbi:MAG: S-methyl-5-thioribose-1-phosphate isomerase [Methanosarcinaceae archaeon]|nr:S-methyl-5-thioribose-1-phosphate isomerase [Methanosarcinaceae archaeon]
MRTIEWNRQNKSIRMVDQTLLPSEFRMIECRTLAELCEAVKNLRVRGAPALAAAGAFGIALASSLSSADDVASLLKDIRAAGDVIKKTRPTAVNLSWGVDRVLDAAGSETESVRDMRAIILDEAQAVADEDVELNKKLGNYGQKLLEDGDVVLTHCNAGRLACVDWGTALGVIRSAVEKKKNITVVSCETRPLNQGSRITCFELMQDNIPVRLITDSAAGFLMKSGLIKKIIVGADRITNDCVVNKIGTYSLAVLAREHDIPFYVAAPTSTFDPEGWEGTFEIEQRPPEELQFIGRNKELNAPPGVPIINPAFDITPMEYVTALITEKGVFEPPFLLDEILLYRTIFL